MRPSSRLISAATSFRTPRRQEGEPSVVLRIELPTRSAICVHLWLLASLGTLRVTR